MGYKGAPHGKHPGDTGNFLPRHNKQLKKLPDKAAASGPQTLDVEKTRTGGTTLRSS